MKTAMLALALVLAGCATPEQAALNARNRNLGQELAAYPDVVVAVRGQEIAGNAAAIAETTFKGLEAPELVPTSPEGSQALQEAVRQRAEEDAGFWAGLGKLAGMVPYGAEAWAGGAGLLVLLGQWWRSRKIRVALRATVQGVQAARDGGIMAAIAEVVQDPDLRELISTSVQDVLVGRLKSAQDESGARGVVKAVLQEVKG